jgi:Flp pilus assembly protein TadD
MAGLLTGWTREEIYYVAQRGYRLYREGKLREAAILFEGLTVIDPDNAYCRKALAAICMRLNQYGTAAAHLDAILARNRFDAEALAGRCEALMGMRDFAAARRDLESLSELPAGGGDARRLRLQLPRDSAAPGAAAPQLPAGAPDNLYGW